MKLQLRLLALLLAGFMVFAYAAPEKARTDAPAAAMSSDDPIARFGSPSEEAVGDLLLQAMSLLGVAYRFGGTSPANGLDCSGFIQYVFQKSLRVKLPRTAAEMARVGRPVDRSELAPGDLVFFNTRGFAFSHVGLYAGNGKFIHSPRTGKNIEVTSMNGSYWVSRYNGARRVSRTSGTVVDDAPERVTSESPARKLREKADSSVRPEPASVQEAPRKKARAAEPVQRVVEDKPAVKCRKGRKCETEATAAKERSGKTASAKSSRKSEADAADSRKDSGSRKERAAKAGSREKTSASRETTRDKTAAKKPAEHGKRRGKD